MCWNEIGLGMCSKYTRHHSRLNSRSNVCEPHAATPVNWTVYMARIEVKNGNQIDMWNDEDEIGLCA